MTLIKYIKLAIILIININLVSCRVLGAGPPVIKCYSELHATEIQIRKALLNLWVNHSKYRVDYDTIVLITSLKTKNINQNSDSLYKYEVEKNFFNELQPRPEPYEDVKFWNLKSANGKIIYKVRINNCNEDSTNCSLCLTAILRLDENGITNWKSWNMTRRERIFVLAHFKQDIIVQLQSILSNEKN